MKLSLETKNLLKETSYSQSDLSSETVEISQVLAWFGQKPDSSNQFQREELCLSFLCDIKQHLLATYSLTSLHKKEKKTSDPHAYALFILLGVSGALLAICDGFDGVASILSLFVGLPIWFVYVVGFSFSLLSLTVFYGFDFVQIAQNLDINLSDTTHLIDVFVEQTVQIKQIRKLLKQIQEMEVVNSASSELAQLVQILKTTQGKLEQCGQQYMLELKRTELVIIKTAVALTAGILFFSYGFFSGQSLAVAILSLYLSTVSLVFWPVMIMSIVVGLASFGVYWFVERPGLENLVGSWLGLDEDKINQLADSDALSKTSRKLSQLERLFTVSQSKEKTVPDAVPTTSFSK